MPRTSHNIKKKHKLCLTSFNLFHWNMKMCILYLQSMFYITFSSYLARRLFFIVLILFHKVLHINTFSQKHAEFKQKSFCTLAVDITDKPRIAIPNVNDIANRLQLL